MNFSIVLDWRAFAVLGVTTLGIIAFCKLEASDVKEVSIHMIDSYKEYVISGRDN